MLARAPSSYLFRSALAERESSILSAFVAPEMFQSGVLRSHLFPLRPNRSRGWEAVLLVNFPIALDDENDLEAEHEFGAVLQRGTRVAHQFNRHVSVRLTGTHTARERYVTFVEFVDLKPGEYTLRAVLSAPDSSQVDAARTVVVVPPLPPRRELSLVPPILGREAGNNLVISGNVDRKGHSSNDRVGSRESFEPLLIQQTDETEALLALTRACLAAKRTNETPPASIYRSVHGDNSDDLGRLKPEPVKLEPSGQVHCDTVLDTLPPAFVDPGRYTFEAILESIKARTEARLPFGVRKAPLEATDDD